MSRHERIAVDDLPAVHHSRQPRRVGKYEAKSQTDHQSRLAKK
jgi:hypothetical protein